MNKDLQQAITVLNQGGIVIFPTDTAFGIGCRVDDEKAVERLYTLRERPTTQPASVLVTGVEMAKRYVMPFDSKVEQLMKDHWPGGLTIVLESVIEKVPALVRGEGTTLGVRMPNHKVCFDLITSVGVPILGPSANFHGEKTPYTLEDLDPQLLKKVDFVLPGECTLKVASTVIDCTKNPWNILREGAVTIII